MDKKRIDSMIDGINKIVELDDPVNEFVSIKKRPKGLQIYNQRIPIGVIGMIYESRPNVTVDSATLCFKAGNAVILRGGSDAINSNKILVSIISKGIMTGLAKSQRVANGRYVQLIENLDRKIVIDMMRLNKYINVLIPRGGAKLIQSVVQNATIPVIETGVGNCHVYVEKSADFAMARKIIENAKVSRPGVCNAIETLLVDSAIAKEFLPETLDMLVKDNVEIRGCERTQQIYPKAIKATIKDWETEYLDLVIAVRVVENIDEAIKHINTYGTKHSEAIITNDYMSSRKFTTKIDAAVVYVNASTRFTDGFEFGFGGEMGISTQKLHVRGPIGLKELTTTKYIAMGDGQIR